MILRIRTACRLFETILVGAIFPTLAASALATGANPAALGTAQRLVAALNAHDTGTIRATCAANATVIDDFPPYTWNGPDACRRWFAALQQSLAATATTKFTVTKATPVFSDATPSRAYIVLAMHLSMNVKRKAASQSGRWALVMRKSGSAWQVTSAAWAQNAGG